MEKFILNRLVQYGFVIENYKILGACEEGYVAVYYGNNNKMLGVIVANTLEYRLKITSALDYLKMKGYGDVSLNTILIMDKKNINEEEARALYFGDSGIVYLNYDKQILGAISVSENLLNIMTRELNEKEEKKKTSLKNIKLTATNVIIGLNIVLYLICAIKSHSLFEINPYVLIEMGAKYNPLIQRAGQYYRFITAVFLHGGIIHLALNMYALKMIGDLIEDYFGTKKFLAIYLISGVASTIASYMFSPYLSIGASGAIFGLFGSALILGYKKKNTIGPQFFKSIVSVIIVNVVIGLSASNIDNFGHFGGLIAGTLVGAAVYKD